MNVDDQINHMLSVCQSEMLQFRQYCCTVCHRMFRKKGIRQLKEETKTSLMKETGEKQKLMIKKCLSFLPKNTATLGEYICHTCFRNLKSKKILRKLSLAYKLRLAHF